MTTKTTSVSRTLIRSMALGVLLSMLFVYAVHVFGKWESASSRPDSQTTATVVLYNKCLFGDTHILRPNYDISAMGTGIDGTKFTGSFMNFSDGHIAALLLISLAFGLSVFVLRNFIVRPSK